MADDHVQSVHLTPISLKGAGSLEHDHLDGGARDDGADADELDVESFRDLMESVRSKLKKEEVQYLHSRSPIKRDIGELRRNSQSIVGGHSQFLETLDCCIGNGVAPSSPDEHDHHEDGAVVITEDIVIPLKGHDDVERYEADNEDLDGSANGDAPIPTIGENQRKCVDHFLVRYSEQESWAENGGGGVGGDEVRYELEIEFNENITLEDQKRNRVSMRGDVLHSLTELIESIMGIRYDDESPPLALSMWLRLISHFEWLTL